MNILACFFLVYAAVGALRGDGPDMIRFALVMAMLCLLVRAVNRVRWVIEEAADAAFMCLDGCEEEEGLE
jgi:hypothetical protein